MIVSTKGRYALQVMVDIAKNDSGNYIPLKEIAARQGISEKYLEAILKVLVREGLLTGLRGKGGGYKFTKPASEYTVWDIISVTEENLVPVACLESGATQCPRASECETLPMWKDFNAVMKDFFGKYTIADLAGTMSGGKHYIL